MLITNQTLADRALDHWPEAFGLAVVLVRDRALAEDLCQEALARIAGLAREVADPAAARPLFLRIVRNLAIDEARKPRVLSLDRQLEDGPPMADPAAIDPLAAVLRSETTVAVRGALGRLDPAWSTMLYMRDGLDFSYAEIAEVVERSVDVVRVTLHRARRRIRAELQTQLDERNQA